MNLLCVYSCGTDAVRPADQAALDYLPLHSGAPRCLVCGLTALIFIVFLLPAALWF